MPVRSGPFVETTGMTKPTRVVVGCLPPKMDVGDGCDGDARTSVYRTTVFKVQGI